MRSEYCPVGKTSDGQFCFGNGVGSDVCNIGGTNTNVVEAFGAMGNPLFQGGVPAIWTCPKGSKRYGAMCRDASNNKVPLIRECPDNLVLKNNKCFPDLPKLICPPETRNMGVLCVDKKGKVFAGELKCDNGKTLKNGICI